MKFDPNAYPASVSDRLELSFAEYAVAQNDAVALHHTELLFLRPEGEDELQAGVGALHGARGYAKERPEQLLPAFDRRYEHRLKSMDRTERAFLLLGKSLVRNTVLPPDNAQIDDGTIRWRLSPSGWYVSFDALDDAINVSLERCWPTRSHAIRVSAEIDTIYGYLKDQHCELEETRYSGTRESVQTHQFSELALTDNYAKRRIVRSGLGWLKAYAREHHETVR